VKFRRGLELFGWSGWILRLANTEQAANYAGNRFMPNGNLVLGKCFYSFLYFCMQTVGICELASGDSEFSVLFLFGLCSPQFNTFFYSLMSFRCLGQPLFLNAG